MVILGIIDTHSILTSHNNDDILRWGNAKYINDEWIKYYVTHDGLWHIGILYFYVHLYLYYQYRNIYLLCIYLCQIHAVLLVMKKMD